LDELFIRLAVIAHNVLFGDVEVGMDISLNVRDLYSIREKRKEERKGRIGIRYILH
jgi:hypothetical protein